MKVFNKTKNCVVAEGVEIARTFREKSDGLLKYETPHAMYFETRWGIHTHGMKFPIDVIVLDGDNMVKKIKKDMKPGRFFFWNPKYKKVLELPVGSNIETGDILELTE